MTAFVHVVDLTQSGNITADAPEGFGPPPADDLIVNNNVTVTSTDGSIFFTAGDDVQIDGTVKALTAGSTIMMTAGVADDDGAGQINLPSIGTISATNVVLQALTGMTLNGTITATTLDVSTTSGGIGAA